MVYPGGSQQATLDLDLWGHSARETDFVLYPSCNQGLKIAVQAHRSKQAGRPPETIFGGVSPITFQATTASVDATDLSGILQLGGRGQRDDRAAGLR